MNERLLRLALPVLVLVIAIVLWGAVVRIEAIPPYVLPSPGLVASTLVSDGPLLMHSLWVTLVTTLEGFALAAIGGPLFPARIGPSPEMDRPPPHFAAG